jgi:arylsulfatase A
MNNSLTRRHFLGALTAAASAQERAVTRPNILLILADDLGIECLGCYGGTSYRTPNLNRLAESGVRFTHAYAQPLCTPTRVQLMTGQHNFRNWLGFGIMDRNEKTFGHMMQKAGYRTAIAGKWQFYSYEQKPSPRYEAGMKPEESGFDEYLLWHALHTEDKGSRYANPVLNRNGAVLPDTKGKYGPDLEVEFLTQFMAGSREKPFFVYYPMTLTHGPFNMTPNSNEWGSGNRLKDDPRHFADMVEYMDHTVGRLVAFLDKSGLASNTILLFYGDNGTPAEITSRLGAKVIPGGKGKTTDAGMHVPLIAQWKGSTAVGKTCSDLIDSTDFIPTMMEATGATWFEGRPLDGRSFLPQIRGEEGQPRGAAFAHYDPHPGQKVNFKATRLAWDHNYKLYMDGRLFNTRKDYFEQSPIANDSYKDRAERRKLQSTLDQMARVSPPKFNTFESDGHKPY